MKKVRNALKAVKNAGKNFAGKKLNSNKRKSQKHDGDNLPGYPYYPVREDLLTAAKDDRVDVDVENLTQSGKGVSAPLTRYASKTVSPASNPPDEVIQIAPGTEADVTEEDLSLLGDRYLEMDGGDDEELLPKIKIGPDFTGDDLDIPGSTPDASASEDAGSEDEENKYYSRGQE